MVSAKPNQFHPIERNGRLYGRGSADTRFFSKYGIPAIEFCPVGKNCHGDDEYVKVDSIYKYKEILKQFALNLNSTKA